VSKVLGDDARGSKSTGDERQGVAAVQVDGSPDGVQSAGGGELELMVPDILPFSNPDISFDNQWDVGSWYGLGWMGMDGFGAYEVGDQRSFGI
jgi:hypothetical protein